MLKQLKQLALALMSATAATSAMNHQPADTSRPLSFSLNEDSDRPLIDDPKKREALDNEVKTALELLDRELPANTLAAAFPQTPACMTLRKEWEHLDAHRLALSEERNRTSNLEDKQDLNERVKLATELHNAYTHVLHVYGKSQIAPMSQHLSLGEAQQFLRSTHHHTMGGLLLHDEVNQVSSHIHKIEQALETATMSEKKKLKTKLADLKKLYQAYLDTLYAYRDSVALYAPWRERTKQGGSELDALRNSYKELLWQIDQQNALRQKNENRKKELELELATASEERKNTIQKELEETDGTSAGYARCIDGMRKKTQPFHIYFSKKDLDAMYEEVRRCGSSSRNNHNSIETVPDSKNKNTPCVTQNQNAQWSTGEKAGLATLVIAACGGILVLTKDTVLRVAKKAQAYWRYNRPPLRDANTQ